MLVFETCREFVRQLGHQRADFFQQRRGPDRQQVGAGEIAVIVRVLLGPHELGLAAVVVPAAGRLDLVDAAV